MTCCVLKYTCSGKRYLSVGSVTGEVKFGTKKCVIKSIKCYYVYFSHLCIFENLRVIISALDIHMENAVNPCINGLILV